MCDRLPARSTGGSAPGRCQMKSCYRRRIPPDCARIENGSATPGAGNLLPADNQALIMFASSASVSKC